MKRVTIAPHEFDALLRLDAVMLHPESSAPDAPEQAQTALARVHMPWPTKKGVA